MILKTFKLGGVHPPENKVSAGAAIQHLPLPDKLFVPLSQHLGTPAKAIVNRGDDVNLVFSITPVFLKNFVT
jgi:electron transport complex protein RnfC